MFRAMGTLPAIAGKYIHPSNPCYCTIFSQLLLDFVPSLFSLQLLVFFPGSTWYCPRFNLGIVPAFYGVGENTSCQKKGHFNVYLV